MAKKSKKNKKSMYENMVESLAVFVVRTAEKDNPMPEELHVMGKVAKMLFRTI
ncbi:hypothetical protein AALD22_26330 [Lachnospiraceae bacterium 56-18]|jgi:hypothetical protein